MTTITTRSIIRAALLSATLAFAASPHLAAAQSGSAGGSIGNTDKTLSGSRKVVRESAPPRPARTGRSESHERRSAKRSSRTSGGDNFDGAWLVASVGRPCGAASEAVLISSGRIVGQYTSGRVAASGQATGSGSSGGVSWTSSGKFSGRRGSGTFQRSDGCVGTWTASKQ